MTESTAIETGTKILKHKHHIIPKHAGGTDDPSNLVELTPEEHAEAHRKLWEEHGNKYDYVAWMTLTGRMTQEEAARNAASIAMKNRVRTEEEFQKGWETRRKNGWKPSDEMKSKQSISLKGKRKPARTDEHRKSLSDSIKKLYDEGKLTTVPPDHSGTKWWNNGISNKRTKECPGEGWTSGRI